MPPFFNNTSIYRRAMEKFLLLAVPVTLLTFYLLLALNRELDFLARDPESYNFHTNRVEYVSPIRRGIQTLRSLSPFYQVEDAYTAFYRDLRFILLFLWGSTAVGGFILVMHMASQISRRLSSIDRSIGHLLKQDLEKEVKIGGPLDLLSIEKQLNQLRLQLSKNERRQLQFLQNVSHDIKTPLTSINEGIKLINDDLLGTLNHEQKEVSQIILKNSKELQTSIESLLDRSRSLAARNEAAREMSEIGPLLEHVVNEQALPLRAKNIRVRLDKVTAFAYINSTQIITVFENILSNAIKYSEHGGEIHVSLSSYPKQVQIIIQDDGRGIPKHEHLSAFNAFFVGETATTDGLKGTGLGLSIARQYVEMHQGTIEVLDSDLGDLSGALLRVCLPV